MAKRKAKIKEDRSMASIGERIVKALSDGTTKSAKEISDSTGISWRAVKRHLEYLQTVGVLEVVEDRVNIKLFRLKSSN